jgi:formate dehydrogenase subunit delta
METERLVSRANEVGDFFGSEPDKQEAAASAATHVRRFWDLRLREQIVAHYHAGGAGLNDTARAAVAILAEQSRQPNPAQA